MILPDDILELIKANKFIYSKHFYARQAQRNLRTINVVQSIVNGQVIEHIESYGNGHKYIIFNTYNNIPFHIVLVFNNNSILLKSIYIPNAPGYENKFKSDLKTRAKGL